MIGSHTFWTTVAEKQLSHCPLFSSLPSGQGMDGEIHRSFLCFNGNSIFVSQKGQEGILLHWGGTPYCERGREDEEEGGRRALNFTKTKPHFHGEARTLPKSRLKCSCGLCGRPQRSRMEQGKNGGWVEFKNLQRKVDSRRARPFSKSEKKTILHGKLITCTLCSLPKFLP